MQCSHAEQQCVILLILYLGICCGKICNYILEMENGLFSVKSTYSDCTSDQNPCVQARSAASKQLVVRLKRAEQFVFYEMTLSDQCLLRVTSIVYANDGSEDEIGVIIYQLDSDDEITDTIEIGEFNTSFTHCNGWNWNTFTSSNHIGENTLVPGKYRICVMAIATDNVELDKMAISADCKKTPRCPLMFPIQPENSNGDNLSATSLMLLKVLSPIVVILIAVIIFLLLYIKVKCGRGRDANQGENIQIFENEEYYNAVAHEQEA